MRVGFLFNHDQIHQVAHSLPIAIAMAEGGFDGEIIIATTNDRMAAEVWRRAGHLIGSRIQHVDLRLSPAMQRVSRWTGKLVPVSKLLIYRDNLNFFRSLDMLVVAEKTSLVLKSRYGLRNLFMVHTRHGAGDRAIGFDKASAGFDHILCSGPKIRRRLIEEAGISPDKISIVGYPKFDRIVEDWRNYRRDPRRPLALYNPHPSPHLSSWYKHGRAVLDHFREQEDREVLFAPHVMLFERPFVVTVDKLRIDRAGKIDNRFLRGDTVHVDLGSRASTDMSYTLAANIYLGDVSSQIYEFLLRPRPCIFLNSHNVEWQGDPNYTHWQAGEVITSPDMLGPALERADELHAMKYSEVQKALFADSFDLTDQPSSERAAKAIVRLAEQVAVGKIWAVDSAGLNHD